MCANESEKLLELLKEVRDLIEEVSRSQLDQYLKEYILHHLYLIDRSIEDYRFQGIAALRSGLEASVGAMVLNQPTFDEAKKSSVGKKFMRILGTYVLIMSAVQSTAKLVQAVTKLLPDVGTAAVESLPEDGAAKTLDSSAHKEIKPISGDVSASSQ